MYALTIEKYIIIVYYNLAQRVVALSLHTQFKENQIRVYTHLIPFGKKNIYFKSGCTYVRF